MTVKEHLTLHDKQIAAIRALVKQGMEMTIRQRQDMRTMMASQKRTEANLDRLIAALGRGSNGKH